MYNFIEGGITVHKIIFSILTAATLFSTTNVLAAKELKLGSRDSQISSVQTKLYEKGYLAHKADGFFGLTTLSAIINFQEDYDIYVSGTVDDNTRNLLFGNSNEIIYNDEDLYWLSRIVFAESRGESYEGKLAVANTVINRVKSNLYPNNVKDVIFDKKHGVQYEPTANGTIYNTPDNDSIKAAKEALDGVNNIGNCMFFFNPKIAQSSWIADNREFYTVIDNHHFYL